MTEKYSAQQDMGEYSVGMWVNIPGLCEPKVHEIADALQRTLRGVLVQMGDPVEG